MPTRRTSVVSFLNLTEAEEQKLLEEIDDLEEGENIYLEICDEESKHFTSLTTFHGMVRIFLSRTWTSLIFWVLVVCTCLVFYMIFVSRLINQQYRSKSGQLLINYSKAVTFQKISSIKSVKEIATFILCNSRLSGFSNNSVSPKCSIYKKPLINNRLRLEVDILPDTEAYLNIEEFDQIRIRRSHSHFLHLEPSEVLRLDSKHSRCVTGWSELKWVQSAPNLTYSYKNCDTAKLMFLVTNTGLDPQDYVCYPPCKETIHRKVYSSLRNRQNLTTLTISYGNSVMVYNEDRKMNIVDVLSLIGGGTSLFLGCSCVTLMETFVFLFKLIVQGLTKEIDTADVDETMTVKPIKLEKVRTIDDPEQGGMAPELRKRGSRHRRRSTLIHIHKEKRSEKKEPDELMPDDNSTNPADTTANKQHLPDHNANNPETDEKSAKVISPILGERIFPRLHRQPAVDVPDEIGDGNTRGQSQSSFILDDFTSGPGNRSILRRASTATSKASNTSRARSLKLMSHVPQKRRSQIFSKHLLMNDF